MDITERLEKILTDQEIKAKFVKPCCLFGGFKIGKIYNAYYNAPSVFCLKSSFNVFNGNYMCSFSWKEFFDHFDIEGDFEGVECIELSLNK